MATTVGSHAVSTFATPVNGGALDANVVRGNDNTIRTAYVAHDDDPGIHVQSSTLASRPAAGEAGRKWITADAGTYKLWYDDGTTWHEVSNSTLDIYVIAGENLVKGDVVKVTGFNTGVGAPTVAKVASASDVAFGIVNETITNGATGYITNTGLLEDVATNSFSIGDILYPNTSGGLTATKPTSGNYQPCAFVLRSNLNNGVLYVEFSAPRIVEASTNTASTTVLRDASGNFSAGTITASLTGNATTATTADKVANALTAGTFLTAAGTFDGSAARTFAVDATSANTASKVVARDASGNFSAGTITAALTGNASTATTLETARTINGVSFNGSANITVTAAAGTLTGATLASGVTASSLTSVGTLTGLTVSGTSSLNGATVVNDAGAAVDFRVESDTNANMIFVDGTNNRVGIGHGVPATTLEVRSDVGNTTLTALTAGNILVMDSQTTAANIGGGIAFGYQFSAGNFLSRAAIIKAVKENATSGNYDTSLVFATTVNAGNTAEEARITSAGDFLVGKTSSADNTAGAEMSGDGRIGSVRSSATPYFANRLTNDGDLFTFQQANVTEGTISVSGTTVSYNGGHLARWSQSVDGTRIDGLLKGTVLSNLDQMAVWINPETGLPQQNEQLNCMKISDVEGDPNVAGVFVNWDNDDDVFTNDMNIAMTGDMIIRIAAGTTVQRGDLLMSAGDGTAKPQGDDILRGKTIAKVTSTHVTCTYPDGSYCVPCVLMAC